MRKLAPLSAVCGSVLWMGVIIFLPTTSGAQQYQTLGPQKGCGIGQNDCHVGENDWWQADKHSRSIKEFRGSQKYKALAAKYGIRFDDDAQINQACMKCHGTVISGREASKVLFGVSCESCHGPGSVFRDVHQKKPGGYAKALTVGMVDNKNLNTRAKTCVSCHYIIDQKLVDAGHPTGADFLYVDGIAEVAKHWKADHPYKQRLPSESSGKLQTAFASAMTTKGPAPRPKQKTQPPPVPDKLTELPKTDKKPDITPPELPRDTPIPSPPPELAETPEHKTIGPLSCGTDKTGCHVKENSWWISDQHYTSTLPFFAREIKYKTIAVRYGLSADDMTKGNQKCMQCHGTVISGNEMNDVEDPVSCESCHGPGYDYREIHSQKGQRQAAIDSGLVDNYDLNIRATTCVRCHYITEQRLVSAGHPTYQDFDYIAGIDSIASVGRHWKREPPPAEEQRPAFGKAMIAKSPVPIVIAPPPPKLDVIPEDNPPLDQFDEERDQPPTRKLRQRQSQRKEEQVIPPVETLKPIVLRPFPAIHDSMNVQQILVTLKKRLESIYQQIGEK